jgi:hypothetical protein
MWNGLWEKLKIKSVIHFKKDPNAVKSDHVEVTLTMPIEVYTLFRQQVEVPHVLRNRRNGDPKDIPANACTEVHGAGA